MPLRNGDCPLGRFESDGHGYSRDPVEACFSCNFGDTGKEGFNLEEICMCPPGISWERYDDLRRQYAASEGEKTRQRFWEFVNARL